MSQENTEPTSAPADASETAAEAPVSSPVADGAPTEAPASERGRGGRDGGREGGRDGRGGGRGRGQRRDDRGADESGFESSVIRIYRCSKVVKGGRTFSFGALVVAGDRKGQVGIGYGKANEVPQAVEKATKEARRSLVKVPLVGTTIPHLTKGKTGSSSVTLVPARPGTGVTAGKSVRAMLELAGVTDILSKAYGSTSPKNLAKATIDALSRLRSAEHVSGSRKVQLAEKAGKI